MSAQLYQLTPQASKNNAFCWLSWPCVIQWRGNPAVEAMTERWKEVMEARRREGDDPANFAGINRKDVVRTPERFALPARGRTC